MMGWGLPGMSAVEPPPGVNRTLRFQRRGRLRRWTARKAGKMRLKSGGGRRALNSTESTSRDGCQGGLWGAGDALQPAAVVLRLPGPAPTPRHSELRQPAPRALSRAVGWWRCRHGASRALTQTCRPQPRQIDATRGQWRCPKVLTGCRTAAGRPQSLRTRPCLAQSATGSLPRRRGATARVPYWELLLHPTRQVGSRHATHATATRHDRHAAPARHVGHRVTRQAAAVTQPRRPAATRPRGRSSERARRGRSKSFLRVGGRRGYCSLWLTD